MIDAVEEGWPPLGWLPIAVEGSGDDARVRWADFGDRRLTEPFFEDSARRVRFASAPYRTRLADLARTAELDDTLPPDGFIFHLSRCGSTLVAQMLAALPDTVVVAEAPPIDSVLRQDIPDMVQLLHAMVRALGRRRTPEARHYVVKLDCWHMPFLPLLREAFPDTPWLFLFRDPVEVLVSHARMPGMQMVPGLHPGAVLGVDPGDPDYRARVLARICEAALVGLDGNGGVAVEHADLPGAVFTTVLPHFGILVDAAGRAAMTAAATRDAKAPRTAFSPDSEDKRMSATPDMRAAAERHVGTLYRRLRVVTQIGTSPSSRDEEECAGGPR